MSNMKIKSSLRDYSVIFIDRLIKVGDTLRDYKKQDVIIVDKNVKKLWSSLFNEVTANVIEIEATEKTKSYYQIGEIIQKLIDNELEYTTTHYRDFVHIEDLCNAIQLCMNSKYLGTIDIGTGHPYKVSDFAPNLPVRLNTPYERNWTCANMEKIKSLGFKPKYSVEKYLTSLTNDNIIKLEIGETL